MVTLPNGVKIFSVIPTTVYLWQVGWNDVSVVPTDTEVTPEFREALTYDSDQRYGIITVTLAGTDEDDFVIEKAYASGADIIIGSMTAAQAYPLQVFALIPHPDTIAPDVKVMRADKFYAITKNSDILTIQEAATATGRSRTLLTRCVGDGELPSMRKNGILLFRFSDLAAWAAKFPHPVGKPRVGEISQQEAAEILGKSKAWVSMLIKCGKLPRNLTVAAVRKYSEQ